MILSRVIEHVKTQNWTAVVLDFFIVVLGVFIGMQLGNWNGRSPRFSRARWKAIFAPTPRSRVIRRSPTKTS